MQQIALTLAVALAISLNLMVIGLLWLCWRTMKGRPADTFEGVSETPTERWPQPGQK